MAAAIDIINEETATHEQRVTAANLVLSTLRSLGCEELIPYVKIEWRKDFVARMGDALYFGSLLDKNAGFYNRIARKYNLIGDGNYFVRIRFSSILWPRDNEHGRKNTVVHEVCHIVCLHEALKNGSPVPSSHGREWKSTMLRAGEYPSRCHSVDRTGLKQSRKQIQATCPCGHRGKVVVKSNHPLSDLTTESRHI